MPFTKLDDGLILSSLMREPPETFKVFIALLSQTGPDGVARISPAALPGLCYLSREQVDTALDTLRAPDPDSRTKEEDGRRIRDVEGGLYVINYHRYRARTATDYLRDKQRQYRDRKRRRQRTSGHAVEDTGEADIPPQPISTGKHTAIAIMLTDEYRQLHAGWFPSALPSGEIIARWRTACEAMLDAGRTVGQIRQAWEAVRGDDFWRENVTGLDVLRDKWNSGRLDAILSRAASPQPKYDPEEFNRIRDGKPA
jgi:hypothetical protein